ncbi:MAG: SAM-dependent methyltransferase [bacterium]|nr:SAM-dependent methyltransferase [bacterium]
MFALSDADLKKRIAGCGDGPASFNAEVTTLGGRVVSIDPIYVLSADDIKLRFEQVYSQIVEGARANLEKYVWTDIASPDEMGERRRRAIEMFLPDYPAGLSEGRYVSASLPDLPFDDGAFELALCSHLLFTYSHLLSTEMHLEAVIEMMRVADETRVFPLLTLNGRPSPHLDPVLDGLRQRGFTAATERVPYEFQAGGNEMLRVTK